MTCEIGLMGLAVMGQNLALNIAEKGFEVAVFNRTKSKVDDCVARAKEEKVLIRGFKDLKEFLQALKKPRRVIIMVKAGPAVDAIIDEFIPHLEKGDMLIDGGNEWFQLTEARTAKLESLGFRYMGMGVSGGEEGARHGCAIMPGGTPEAYDFVKHILEKIAAQVDGTPCVSYMGRGGAGNYVKMVHNGIEYGDMQLIAESYDIMKRLGLYSNKDLSKLFYEWNQGELQSFLIEISADIFAKADNLKESGDLIDRVLDVAGSKGTGMWTVQEAAQRGVPCPTIQAALDSRYISSFKQQRMEASDLYQITTTSAQIPNLAELVRDSLYCSKICSYAQGMMLLKKASDEFNWNLKLDEIAKGWRGGCIIRAKLLGRITEAFSNQPNLPSLLMYESFAHEIKDRLFNWRKLINIATEHGIATPALSASLSYFTSYTSKLPMNLVQAQRDYFGAHTYQRNDTSDGKAYHSDWSTKAGKL